jgi:hypothetical protein
MGAGRWTSASSGVHSMITGLGAVGLRLIRSLPYLITTETVRLALKNLSLLYLVT